MSSSQNQHAYQSPTQRRWQQSQGTTGHSAYQAHPQNSTPNFDARFRYNHPGWSDRTDLCSATFVSDAGFPDVVRNDLEDDDYLNHFALHPHQDVHHMGLSNDNFEGSLPNECEYQLEGTAYLDHFAIRPDPDPDHDHELRGNEVTQALSPDYRTDLDGEAYLNHFAIQPNAEAGEPMCDVAFHTEDYDLGRTSPFESHHPDTAYADAGDTSSEYKPPSSQVIDDQQEEDLTSPPEVVDEITARSDTTKRNVFGLTENDQTLLKTFSDTFFSLRSSRDPRLKDIGRGRWGGKKSILATYDQDKHHTDLKHFQTIIDGLCSQTLDKWPPISEIKLKSFYQLAKNVPVVCNPSKTILVDQVESIVNKVCDTNIRNFIYPYLDYTKPRGEATFTEEQSVFYHLASEPIEERSMVYFPSLPKSPLSEIDRSVPQNDRQTYTQLAQLVNTLSYLTVRRNDRNHIPSQASKRCMYNLLDGIGSMKPEIQNQVEYIRNRVSDSTILTRNGTIED
ncbi:hypothetical protein L486_08544 [Kwoniella mangroviensis CBS 10435]|uniref:Uncharacterized protein n=1 Tax=Kwoniella mangroviensis CBS 10435 TaxID=1331196 RepID=A0A1B9IEA7_9TREE|nr:uncharacterized protein I203_08394 [Kwoniella mangroviensis CBS 8507]OCF53969.1 hypothetical protein L486_08544 [Kwoniella mangroviensis CBS 10435]OCF62540.1 hypothetical protein I203_08394 [Kwoniella mangroviensis CBS 8507]